MKQAVIYTRVSSREQQQEGFSLGAQTKLLQEYAERNGLSVVQAFEDVETAKKSGRAQFDAMVTWFKRNRSCRVLLVEKTDRLTRNFRDAVTLEDLDIEIHFIKESGPVSKDSKSQTRMVQGMYLVMARNYSENLREEVKKGMKEKASQGYFPGYAPFGYRNNKAERICEIDPDTCEVVKFIFSAYVSGTYTLTTLAKHIRLNTGVQISRANVHRVLKNRFYIGFFEWGGETYVGKHPAYIDRHTFDAAQAVLTGHNRPKYSKRDIAFRGLLTCANDGCLLTGDVQKEKYIYYRCTGHHGKCGLPRFREEDVASRLGEPLKGLQVPVEVVSQIVSALRADEGQATSKANTELSHLNRRLTSIRHRMDAAYEDKLDGNITEDYWNRKKTDWLMEEQQVKMAIAALENAEAGDRALSAEKIFELANRAYSLYVSQDSTEKAKLLRILVSNCSVGDVNTTFDWRKPFDTIFQRAQNEEWSEWRDSNSRPPAPEAGALPGCATFRHWVEICADRVPQKMDAHPVVQARTLVGSHHNFQSLPDFPPAVHADHAAGTRRASKPPGDQISGRE
jgi:site-specific DNA recombinase